MLLKFVRIIGFSVGFASLIACTEIGKSGLQVDSRATAVSPAITPIPTATHTPVIIIELATPTVTAVPTRTEAEKLADFVIALEDNLNNGRFQTIDNQLAHPFYVTLYPATINNQAAIHDLQHHRYLPPAEHRNVSVDLAATQSPLPELDGAWWLAEEIIAVIPSTGWGPAGLLNGLIIVTQKDGEFRWAGLLLSRSGFDTPSWETVSPPPGLVYFWENSWWQVEADSEPKLLLAHDIDLNLSPNATFALRQSGNQTVTSFDLSRGISETVDLGATLMSSTSRFRWLDEETAVFTVTEDGPHQQSVGPILLLNVRTGQSTTLSPEVSIYTQPTISSEQTIVIDVTQDGELWTWQNDREQFTKIAGLGQDVESIYYPALSPDGAKVAGITGGDFGLHHSAFAVVDMTQPTHAIVHTYLPLGTDAVLPAGISWSPDSQWLALLPGPTWDMESNLWLVSADGGTKIDLGVSSSNPVWLDAERLMFTAVTNHITEIHLYDLSNNQRLRLDLPMEATPIQFVPDY